MGRKSIADPHRGSIKSLGCVLQHVRQVQVKISLFNQVHSWLVYEIKLAFLGTSILFGFAAIQLFHEDRVLSIISAVILLDNLCVFTVLYDKGFSIPRRVERLRSLLVFKLRTSQVITEQGRDMLMRQVKSVGTVAVRVGQFHYLERASTPRYMDFSMKNIMRLVMAYRRNHNY